MWLASIAMSRRLESTENRPIVWLESLDHCGRPRGIARNRQVKHPNYQIAEELKVIEAEARETDKALQHILKQLGIGA